MSALSDALNEANVENWSAREIARRGGDRVHFATIATYLRGKHGRPGEEILQVFSEVLHVPMSRLRQLADLPSGDEQPYEPPPEANRLDRRQRKLVDELIRMLAESKAGDGDVGRDAAPMKTEQGSVRRGTAVDRLRGIDVVLSDLTVEWEDEPEREPDLVIPDPTSGGRIWFELRQGRDDALGETRLVAGSGSGKTEVFANALISRLRENDDELRAVVSIIQDAHELSNEVYEDVAARRSTD